MKFILRLFVNFRYARKRLGGKWYYLAIGEEVSGFGGQVYYWTQREPTGSERIMKEENHG